MEEVGIFFSFYYFGISSFDLCGAFSHSLGCICCQMWANCGPSLCAQVCPLWRRQTSLRLWLPMMPWWSWAEPSTLWLSAWWRSPMTSASWAQGPAPAWASSSCQRTSRAAASCLVRWNRGTFCLENTFRCTFTEQERGGGWNTKSRQWKPTYRKKA